MTQELSVDILRCTKYGTRKGFYVRYASSLGIRKEARRSFMSGWEGAWLSETASLTDYRMFAEASASFNPAPLIGGPFFQYSGSLRTSSHCRRNA